MTDRPAQDRVTAIYDAIDAFQRTHRTGGGLQHAQIRALLAEHLDRALPTLTAASPARRCVNDTDGDGDCAACARNPEASCRLPLPDRAAVLCAAVDRLERMPGYPRLVLPEELMAELRRLAAEASADSATCGRTRDIRGNEYPPCRRAPGHGEAYCRSADGNAYFLAVNADQPVAEVRQDGAQREPDPDCEHCDGSGLDPDRYTVRGDVWTHEPCSECLPEDDEPAPPREPHPTEADLRHAQAVLARFQGRDTSGPAASSEASTP